LTALHEPQAGTLHKPPQREGILVFEISQARTLFQRSQTILDQDISDLKRSFGFPANESVAIFLAHHRSIPPILLAAVPRLKEYFGQDNIFNLEVSMDDDHSQTLYAVAIWHGTVQTAAQALDAFAENWWLDRMASTTADLVFTYQLA
jgi:hypothetical protein